MSISPIALIEDGIIRTLGESGLPYLRTVATYGGELDGDILKTVRAFPAVWVAYKGADAPRVLSTSRSAWVVSASWVVLVAARNLRNEASTRHGDGVEVGTYQMLHDVHARLLDKDFTCADSGLEMDPLSPGRVRSLFNGKLQTQGVSVYAQEWHTRYVLRATDGDGTGGELPDLLALGLRYHLHPDGGEPDAVDLLTLQGSD